MAPAPGGTRKPSYDPRNRPVEFGAIWCPKPEGNHSEVCEGDGPQIANGGRRVAAYRLAILCSISPVGREEEEVRIFISFKVIPKRCVPIGQHNNATAKSI